MGRPRRTHQLVMHEQPLTSEIRSAIAESGLTLYELARQANIQEASLRRFASRASGLNLDSADKLATALGLKLIRKPKGKATRPAHMDP